jgi:hypothetical protein
MRGIFIKRREEINTSRILVGKRDGKGLLGRTRRRWKDNISTDLREINWVAWNGFNWFKIRLLSIR